MDALGTYLWYNFLSSIFLPVSPLILALWGLCLYSIEYLNLCSTRPMVKSEISLYVACVCETWNYLHLHLQHQVLSVSCERYNLHFVRSPEGGLDAAEG